MNKQKLMVLLAFSCLLIIATIIGCTAVQEGFLIPVEEGAEARFAFVVNAENDCDCSFSISVFSVEKSTGKLTAAAGSPFTTAFIGGNEEGTSFIDVDPNSRFVYVPLGNQGKVAVYSVNQSTGALTEIGGSPFTVGEGGDRPYSAKVDPTGKVLYVTNRNNDEIYALSVDQSTGALATIGSFELDGFPYQIIMDPQGRFLYVGVDTGEGAAVQGFKINSSAPVLTPVPGEPGGYCALRSGTVDATGHFLLIANPCEDNVSVFTIDQSTGALAEVANSPFDAGSGPFHVVEAVNGGQSFVAVNNLDSANISVYTFNTSTGELKPVTSSPFTFANASWTHYMAVDFGNRFGYVADFGNGITGVTITQNGTLAQITGSPFTSSTSPPTQIVLGR